MTDSNGEDSFWIQLYKLTTYKFAVCSCGVHRLRIYTYMDTALNIILEKYLIGSVTKLFLQPLQLYLTYMFLVSSPDLLLLIIYSFIYLSRLSILLLLERIFLEISFENFVIRFPSVYHKVQLLRTTYISFTYYINFSLFNTSVFNINLSLNLILLLQYLKFSF